MTLPARWLTCFLSAAILLAATLPCPTTETATAVVAHHAAHTGHTAAHTDSGGPTAGHAHHGAAPKREHAMPCHEEPPVLSAVCPCGCNRAGAGAAGSGGRLGTVLPSHAVAAQAFRATLPVRGEPPRIPAEPWFTPDPIPI